MHLTNDLRRIRGERTVRAWGTVSVLASCETAHDVGLARARGYATALVVEEFASDKLYDAANGARNIHESIPASVTHEGQSESSSGFATSNEAANGGVCPESAYKRSDAGPQFGVGNASSRPRPTPILPCPSQTRGVHCSDCRLCFDDGALRKRGYSIGFELHGVPFAVSRARLALRDPGHPLRRKTTRELIPVYLAENPSASDAQMARAFGVTAGSVTQMRHKLERAA